ncbi:hypothetical protein [Cellulosimicrobium sp. CUA-896]|uniref:hypothetical protein n=1 Tax=Cellulosimicrobium sp. CUA-896 TaxID=1517881 RepID=UPI001115144D|nr:hypothetical protein [Cellulosimicrobium sp. CUA-896]
MSWVAVGWAMIVLGCGTTVVFARRARVRTSGGADGLAVGCGASLALWGVIVVVVATVLQPQ